MLRSLLLGIGIGGIIFTKKGKEIINGPTNTIKKYIMKEIANTDIIKMGKEFIKGLDEHPEIKEIVNNTDNKKEPSKECKKESIKKY